MKALPVQWIQSLCNVIGLDSLFQAEIDNLLRIIFFGGLILEKSHNVVTLKLYY